MKNGEVVEGEFNSLFGAAVKLIFTVEVVGISAGVSRGHQDPFSSVLTVDDVAALLG